VSKKINRFRLIHSLTECSKNHLVRLAFLQKLKICIAEKTAKSPQIKIPGINRA